MFPSKSIQKNYVLKISELMLLYCYKKRKEKNFFDLINDDCDIYRKTNIRHLTLKQPVLRYSNVPHPHYIIC